MEDNRFVHKMASKCKVQKCLKLYSINQRATVHLEASFHLSEFFSEIVKEFSKLVSNQWHSKQIWRIETKPKRAVCSYWSMLTIDDSNFFVLGSLLGDFAEKLNFFQLWCFAREFACVPKEQKTFQ